MNYETVKSFILFVLVSVSFLLSFILWTYQPKYDLLYDTSYVNEVDVGGTEKTKNELIEPNNIIFHHDDAVSGFTKPVERQRFFKELSSWVLYDYQERDAEKEPASNNVVEIIFPSETPVELITNLFTFDDQITAPNWSFERVYISLDESEQIAELLIRSTDNRKQITATIDKTETYYYLLSHMEDETEITESFMSFDNGDGPIYFPRKAQDLAEKTFISSSIEPESFINALFTTPSIVTANISEAYFTDGQRGMKVVQDGRRLEYINPIQTSNNRMEAMELIDKSANHINEHQGWTNDFLLERLELVSNTIYYRMYYEGYPTFDNYRLTVIEEQWREQELHQYIRPLVSVGNLLNSTKKTLDSGETIAATITNSNKLDHKEIKDIRIGYTMQYVDDAYSLTLDPEWYILYKGEWTRFSSIDFEDHAVRKVGD